MRRRLGIETGEGRILVLGTLALALLGGAEVSLRNLSETLFLKRVGVGHLPAAFLVTDALLLAATSLFAVVAVRSDRLRWLPRMLAGMGIALLPLWPVAGSEARLGFVGLLAVSRLVPSLALVAFWIAMGDLLHGRQAKRLFAPITAGGTLGAIAGSFASGPLGRELGIGSLLPIAAGMLGLAALAARPLRRLRPRLDRGQRPGARARPEARRDAAPGPTAFGGLWRESGLFRGLVAIALCSAALAPMLYFEFSYLADRATQGAEGEGRLLAFYASFRGWIHLGVLVAQLFATSRLFRRIGIPLASAIPPLVYLAGFGALAAEASLASGVAAMAATRLQDRAVYDPALRVLWSLLPESIRSRASAILEGPTKRLGGVVGNVAVLGALGLGSAALVNLAALPIALAWLLAALWLWRRYPDLLLRSAAARASRDAWADTGLLDRATARALAAELAGEDPARTRAAISLLVDAEPGFAAEALAAALARAPEASRALLVAGLDRVLEARAGDAPRSAEAARALEALLAAPSGGGLSDRDRSDLVQAYGRLCPHARAAGPLRAALADASPAVRLAALAALDRLGAAPPGSDLETELAAAVAGGDAAARRAAREECRWSLLAGANEAVFAARLGTLARLLGDAEQRADAAEAIAEVAVHRGEAAGCVADAMWALREDPDPRVRAACLRYVGCAGLAEHAGWLVAHLGDPRAEWSEAARAGLRALGPLAVDALLRELGFGSRRARADAVEILRDLEVDRERLAALYDRELELAERDLLHAAALGDRERFAMLRQRLAERVDEHLHAALGLLAALHDDDRIGELADELRHARGGRRHSVLLEALESLLARRERSRLVPLLEDGQLGARVRKASAALGRGVPGLEQALEALLGDREDLARALAAASALARRSDLRDHREVRPVEIALQLRALPFFAGLTTRQLVDLARVVKEERHPPGASIASEGAFDDCLYLLLEGVVRVSRRGAFLTELGPGSFFGEIALFEGGARSASVTALSHVRTLRLERADLFALMDDLPGLAIAICRGLSRRVRELTERLEELTMHPGAEPGPAPSRGPGPEATAS